MSQESTLQAKFGQQDYSLNRSHEILDIVRTSEDVMLELASIAEMTTALFNDVKVSLRQVDSVTILYIRSMTGSSKYRISNATGRSGCHWAN